MSENVHFSNFSTLLSGSSPTLLPILSLFPKHLVGFEFSKKEGEFRLEFDREYLGALKHDEPALRGTTLRIEKEVKGTIEGNILTFKSGISLIAGFGPVKLEVSLTQIKGQDDHIELTGGKWGQTRTYSISTKELAQLKIEWF